MGIIRLADSSLLAVTALPRASDASRGCCIFSREFCIALAGMGALLIRRGLNDALILQGEFRAIHGSAPISPGIFRSHGGFPGAAGRRPERASVACFVAECG